MNRKNAVLMEKQFYFENIDENGDYVKSKGRDIEQLGFYIRIMQLNFIPCPHCQKRLIKEMMESKQWSIGNKDTDPPVELWRKFELDDNAWEEVERHKATEEEKERVKDGFGNVIYFQNQKGYEKEQRRYLKQSLLRESKGPMWET